MASSTPLVSFEDVSKRYRDGYREIVVLDNASFEFEAEVFIGVWGARRAGKSTLLRLMAGVESPDSGIVRFDGRDVGAMPPAERERLLRGDIALMAAGGWCARPSETVVDYVALSLGSSASSVAEARRRARRALDRVGMTDHADEATRSLSLSERMRAVLAQALVREPRLLLVDEPALVPSLVERDAFYTLLRDVGRELRATLVIASEDMAPLHGAEVVMSIGDGELCSTDERGTVVDFPDGSPVARPEP
jgi:ABC-type multidrug transport system ATPase subunit